MNRTLKSILFVVFGLLATCSLSQAGLFGDKIDKAGELIAINRYQEAHRLLDQVILENPGDASVHYRAGIAYLKMDWANYANKCFDNVYLKRPNRYMKTVSKYYEHEGFLLAARGRTDKAIYSLKRAFLFNSSVKRAVVKEMKNLGYDNWNNELEKNAYYFFKVSVAFDNTLGDEYSDFYFNKCSKSDKPCFNFYRRAQEFSHKNDHDIGWLLVALAKMEGISEKHQKEIKTEVVRYLSKAEILKAFPPDYIQYKHGEETPIFELVAGQTTEKWIRPPKESSIKFYSNNRQWEVYYRNGYICKVWAGEKLDKIPKRIKGDFKIRAKKTTRVKTAFNKL